MRYNEIESNIPKVGRDHSNMLFLMGHSGAGKSYLASRLSERAFISEKVDIYNVGDELVNSTGGNVTKDRIKDSSQDKASTWLSFTLGLLAGRSQIRPILVTAHYPYEQGLLLVTPEDDYREIKPAGYVFVYAEPEQIQAWRGQDTARNRPELSIPLINSLQRLSFLATQSLARETGARMITVWNKGDNVEENVNKIEAVAQELFSA